MEKKLIGRIPCWRLKKQEDRPSADVSCAGDDSITIKVCADSAGWRGADAFRNRIASAFLDMDRAVIQFKGENIRRAIK